jgi:hypothetical protein
MGDAAQRAGGFVLVCGDCGEVVEPDHGVPIEEFAADLGCCTVCEASYVVAECGTGG